MSKERDAILQKIENYQNLTLKELADTDCSHKCNNCQWKYRTVGAEQCIALAVSMFLNRKYDETLREIIEYDKSHNG